MMENNDTPTGEISMSYEKFSEIWQKSGLPEYYESMDDLKRYGMTFDENGDMEFQQSEALNLVLHGRKVSDLTQENRERAAHSAVRIAATTTELATLKARLAEVEKVCGDFAAQRLVSEIDDPYDVECADFEGAYESMIADAREVMSRGAPKPAPAGKGREG